MRSGRSQPFRDLPCSRTVGAWAGHGYNGVTEILRSSFRTNTPGAPLTQTWHPTWAKIRGVASIIRSLLAGQSEYEAISVFGDEEYRKVVIEALRLLRERAPDNWPIIKKHIKTLCRSRSSFVFVPLLPATAYLNVPTGSPPEFVAGNIAHEAFHCFLYWEFASSNPGMDVPEDIYSGEEAEQKCVEFQCSVMKALGVSEKVLAAYKEAPEFRCWEIPWELRDW